MHPKHLMLWQAEAFPREGKGKRSNWDPFVNLVQHEYATGEIPTALLNGICVLLLKAEGGVQGLGLLEVIWKTIASILCEHMSVR